MGPDDVVQQIVGLGKKIDYLREYIKELEATLDSLQEVSDELYREIWQLQENFNWMLADLEYDDEEEDDWY
jgi:prefoldin subunit 5